MCLSQPKLLTKFSPDTQHTDPTPSKPTHFGRKKRRRWPGGTTSPAYKCRSYYTKKPPIDTYPKEMQEQKDKTVFLTCTLNLSHDTIADHPELLMASLPKRLGPRWECLQQLKSHAAIDFTDAHEVIYPLARIIMTDPNFSATHAAPNISVYDEQFGRLAIGWAYFLFDQQLIVRTTIAEHG